MSWLEKIVPSIGKVEKNTQKQTNMPEGLWCKCEACGVFLYAPELDANNGVCPKCNFHNRLSGRKRLDIFLDKDLAQEEIAKDLEPVDKLKFKDHKKYKDRLTQAQKDTGEKDALIAIKGFLHEKPIVACAFDFNFMGGSMGSVVGEKFTQAATLAAKEKIPFVCFSASGGARMQEALFSLMQMAKTAAVLEMLSHKKIPYISVITDPCYGGVSASLAMLGDINIVEPNASCGFSGPRVIEQTIREKLPEGFQNADFLLKQGFADMVVHRNQLRTTIASVLSKLTNQELEYEPQQ